MNKWIIGLIALVVLVIGAWYYISKPKVAEGEPVRIGVIATLTGVGAYQGEQSLKGLEFARDEINASGGINGRPIELVVEDSATNPTTAVSAINKLISVEKVRYIVGDSWTSTTAALVPIANEQGVILVSPLATLDTLAADDYFFRTMPTTNSMMEALSEYAYSELGARRAGILRQATPFGVEHARDFETIFRILGGEVVVEEEFDVASSDVRTQITKVKAANPDVVFNLHATGPRVGLLIEQAKELGLETRWIGSWGSENGALLSEYGSIIEDLVYPYPYDAESAETAVRNFAAAYMRKHDEVPDLSVASSYDALRILVSVLKNSDGSADDVKTRLLLIRNYRGASGAISFDENGDVQKSILIKQIKGGEFVRVK